MSRIAALVVAGGRASRMEGSLIPKQYLEIKGKTILQYTLERLSAHPKIEHIQLVVDPKFESYYLPVLRSLSKFKISLSEAGVNRTGSVFSGLKGLLDFEPEYVLIHDAVRPFTSLVVIDRVIGGLLHGYKGVIPITLLQDTVVQREDERLIRCLDREKLCSVQTPQGFIFHEILSAYNSYFENPSQTYTDDGSLALEQGMEIKCVLSSRENFKITYPFDLKFADFLMSQEHS